MKRLVNILLFLCLSSFAFAQGEMRIIDSLESVMAKQEGREKVETMMELSDAFFDFSFDDCIDWGEKAIKEAQRLGFVDLEGDANYTLGLQYGYHADLDLAQEYLDKAYSKHMKVGNEEQAVEDLWKRAYFEQVMGNIDTAFSIYGRVMDISERNLDTMVMAKALCNMAIIQYQLLDFNHSEASFLRSRDLYDSMNDTMMILRINANLACLYMEWSNSTKARSLFLDVIPKLEAAGDYGLLILAYKNYGQLFVKDYHDFDSAGYYYRKAYSILELLESEGVEVDADSKVDLLVEMGNALYNDDNYKDAEGWYLEAFRLAESSSYASGQILACVGLGMVYSYLSQPVKSLYYLNLIDELESKSGISIAYSTIKVPLILNYARLGKYYEMGYELNDFKEQYDGLLRESNDLYDQISTLQNDAAGLLAQYETQNEQIKTLQTQRNHYRLAFFGLLAIALFAMAVLIAYKIVRKNRVKNVKS